MHSVHIIVEEQTQWHPSSPPHRELLALQGPFLQKVFNEFFLFIRIMVIILAEIFVV